MIYIVLAIDITYFIIVLFTIYSYSLCERKSITHEVSTVYTEASRKKLEEEIEAIKSGREPLDNETIR